MEPLQPERDERLGGQAGGSHDGGSSAALALSCLGAIHEASERTSKGAAVVPLGSWPQGAASGEKATLGLDHSQHQEDRNLPPTVAAFATRAHHPLPHQFSLGEFLGKTIV